MEDLGRLHLRWVRLASSGPDLQVECQKAPPMIYEDSRDCGPTDVGWCAGMLDPVTSRCPLTCGDLSGVEMTVSMPVDLVVEDTGNIPSVRMNSQHAIFRSKENLGPRHVSGPFKLLQPRNAYA